MILKIAQIVSLAAFGFSAIAHGITLLMPNFAEQSYFAIFIYFPLSVTGTFWCIWQIDLWASLSDGIQISKKNDSIINLWYRSSAQP